MWFHSSNRLWQTRVISCCLLLYSMSVSANTLPKHVILITIDGMHAGMVNDPSMPSPHLKKMKQEGFFVEKVRGVPPTSTYPSHTSIVTGALPVHHGIYYNAPFAFNRPSNVSNWYADSIRTTTIWQVAKQHGLSTASLFWPVSTGSKWIDYNVPEYWSTQAVDNQMEFLKAYCTPLGILEELEEQATGQLNHITFAAGSIHRDARTAYMANYLLNTYRPNLLTVHLITTDYAQHATGMNSEQTRMAVASSDNAVGLIIDNLKRNGLADSTVVIVCGDHGFTDTQRSIAPNVWLVQEKLLSEKVGGEWKACFHGSGATMFLYLKNKKDLSTLNKIRKKLASLPADTRALFRVVEADELASLGACPDVVLAIEPVLGVGVATQRTGADILHKAGGKHGYLSGIDPTCLLVYGVAKRGTLPAMNQVDIAPYVMNLLGISAQFADGKMPEMMK